jgi:UDPglucose 6-dehydrogenase
MKICVVGSGYVGLVTGSCLADFGMHVTGVDVDEAKVAALQRCEIPIYEPGLDELVRKNMEQNRLRFTTELGPALEEAQVVFIAVGTPPKPDGSADLRFIRQVAESIGDHLNGFKVIVTKSTVPIGTGQMISRLVAEKSSSDDFAVVSNPEFLREGSLATKITFINEVTHLCEKLGADVETVARGMGLDSRIGPKFLHPGPGYGGSCFPKDSRAVAQIARDLGLEFRIMDAVIEANDQTRDRMVEKIVSVLDGVAGKTIAILGLSFKPETDDIRESPALTIVDGLRADGARVRAFDPAAMEECRRLWDDVVFCDSPYEAAEGADGLVIVTEWNRFRFLDTERLKGLLKEPLIIDLRNIYEPAKMGAAGFRYVSLGRPEGRPHEGNS